VDFQHVVAHDRELLTELLDRQGELEMAAPARGGLESLEGGTLSLSGGLDRMREGFHDELRTLVGPEWVGRQGIDT